MGDPPSQSSGDLIADRRYAFGRELVRRGDFQAAADLFAQAVEATPGFAAGWFALGEARMRLGQTAEAIEAFRRVHAIDPQDHFGATLQLALLGAAPLCEMPTDYVRTLFDQYAPRFETALVGGLSYRGPELLRAAVTATCDAAERPTRFARAFDLGCGTGLGGVAFRPFVDHLTGVDVAPKMVAAARSKRVYDDLAVGDLIPFMSGLDESAFDLVLAADVLPYLAELAPLLTAIARVLRPGGMLAFSAETHDGGGIVLGAKLRFGHGTPYLRSALAVAGLKLLHLDPSSIRNEDGQPVPGLIAVATHE